MLTALIYTAGAIAIAAILAATGLACCLLASRRPAERFDQHADRALAGVTQLPAAGNAVAPVPQASAPPALAAPPPGHRAALDMAPPTGRCTWCGWHRVYRPCCGWLWVPEICPAHQTRRTTR